VAPTPLIGVVLGSPSSVAAGLGAVVALAAPFPDAFAAGGAGEDAADEVGAPDDGTSPPKKSCHTSGTEVGSLRHCSNISSTNQSLGPEMGAVRVGSSAGTY
jgi:hypothetical protein